MGRKDSLTVANLLSEDTRKQIAERLLDGQIKDIVIIYNEDNAIYWNATVMQSHVIGMCEVVRNLALARFEEAE